MASPYERDYCAIVKSIMSSGQHTEGRNGGTTSLFGTSFTIRNTDRDFPMLYGRKLYPEGVFGEFAAMIRGPKTIADFEKFGCNYWKKWGKEDGTIDLDYGNQWIDFNGVNQIKEVVKSLKENPSHRRHLISGWRPDRLDSVDLPCCHMLYQWYVRGDRLDMIWYQRSADFMIGVPADVILATLFNICMAEEVGLKSGAITFIFGDSHIYDEHLPGAKKYLEQVKDVARPETKFDTVKLCKSPLTGDGMSTKFIPEDIKLLAYSPEPAINFELKA